MAAPPPQHSELGELARCLRQERLYVSLAVLVNLPCVQQRKHYWRRAIKIFPQVSYEKKQLQQLNEQLATAGRRLAQSAWTTFQQRENLEVKTFQIALLDSIQLARQGFGDVPRRLFASIVLPASQPSSTSSLHRRLQAPLASDGLLQRVSCCSQVQKNTDHHDRLRKN